MVCRRAKKLSNSWFKGKGVRKGFNFLLLSKNRQKKVDFLKKHGNNSYNVLPYYSNNALTKLYKIFLTGIHKSSVWRSKNKE